MAGSLVSTSAGLRFEQGRTSAMTQREARGLDKASRNTNASAHRSTCCWVSGGEGANERVKSGPDLAHKNESGIESYESWSVFAAH